MSLRPFDDGGRGTARTDDRSGVPAWTLGLHDRREDDVRLNEVVRILI